MPHFLESMTDSLSVIVHSHVHAAVSVNSTLLPPEVLFSGLNRAFQSVPSLSKSKNSSTVSQETIKSKNGRCVVVVAYVVRQLFSSVELL